MQTILLVDDDESLHFLCEMVIKRSGKAFRLLKAFDGLEALEILKSGDSKPDLILLDINMPRMNGHQFLAEYAKLAENEIPIVAMLTSSNEQHDRQNAMTYSCVKDYLIKPLSKEHLDKLEAVYDEVFARHDAPATTAS